MKENVSFRSSFNGFNREDVVTYISGLMDRIAESEQEQAEAEQQAAELEETLNVMRNSSSAWEQERETWQARFDSLEKECELWKSRCAEMERKTAEIEKNRTGMSEQDQEKWQACCDSLKKDCDSWKARCAELEEQNAALEKECTDSRTLIDTLERKIEDCDNLSKNNEVKLGAAMMEAKRFSEMLVKEANDRAGAVYSIASSSVKDSAESIGKLKAQMISVTEEFTRSMNCVLTHMDGLINGMNSFREDAKGIGAKFTYRSEFIDKAD